MEDPTTTFGDNMEARLAKKRRADDDDDAGESPDHSLDNATGDSGHAEKRMRLREENERRSAALELSRIAKMKCEYGLEFGLYHLTA